MNIRQKIVIALLCVSLPALMAVGGFGYWRAHSSIELSRTLSLEAIAASRMTRLENLLRDWRENLRTVASDRLLTDTVHEYNRTSYARFSKRLARILRRAVGAGGIQWLQIHDHSGAVIASAGKPLDQALLPSSSPNDNGFNVLRVSRSSPGRAPLVTMRGPIRVAQANVAYITAQLRARGLNDLVRDRHGLGESGQLQIWWTGDKGNVAPVVGAKTPLVQPPSRSSTSNGQARLVQRDNTEWLMASLQAHDADLAIVVTLDSNEALHQADQLGTALLAFCLGLFVLVLLAGFWVGGRLSAGVRALSDVAVLIRHGQLQRRANISGNDEVAVLGHAFNEMAEALINANSSLERRVEERTAELALANAALEQRNSELARSNTDLVEFASVASHDLQEPLRKVQAFGDRLADCYAEQLDDRGQDYIRRMQQSAARMRTLIDDLLAFSRVQSQTQAYSEVDLNKVVEEVCCELEEQLQASQGSIEVSELPAIAADHTQMLQLFQNLIGNALKYAKADAAPVIRVGATTHGGHVCIKIVDNGIGFEPRHAERIFGIFQRLHGREVYQGTGVGLAICKRIVERHDGTIYAQGLPTLGATFVVTFPLSAGQAPPTSSHNSDAPLIAVGGR